jgi:hypothetical protein
MRGTTQKITVKNPFREELNLWRKELILARCA